MKLDLENFFVSIVTKGKVVKTNSEGVDVLIFLKISGGILLAKISD